MKPTKLLHFLALAVLLFFPQVLSAQSPQITIKDGIDIFRKSYPDLTFDYCYDPYFKDFKVTVDSPELGSKELFWNNGAMISEEELKNKNQFTSLLYAYPKIIIDPADMDEQQRAKLKEYGTVSSRKTSAGSSMAFYDYLYDSYSYRSVEKQIKNTTFLGKRTSIHKRILPQLKKVESRINELSRTDKETAEFLAKIKSTDAYCWRLIDGTNRKSFHSTGVAIDILPTRITGEIFWSWARDKNPSGWMLTPLSKRWLVPDQVVRIFEEEGFVWGGKWAIWDNMHFEYRPEIINYNHAELFPSQ